MPTQPTSSQCCKGCADVGNEFVETSAGGGPWWPTCLGEHACRSLGPGLQDNVWNWQSDIRAGRADLSLRSVCRRSELQCIGVQGLTQTGAWLKIGVLLVSEGGRVGGEEERDIGREREREREREEDRKRERKRDMDGIHTLRQPCGLHPLGSDKVLKKLLFHEAFSVDVKVASTNFLCANGWGRCHFKRVEDVVEAYTKPDSTLYCAKHKRQCRVGFAPGTCDLLIVGFPCSPYSIQRRDRWSKGSSKTNRS